jgi:hypothetical protein
MNKKIKVMKNLIIAVTTILLFNVRNSLAQDLLIEVESFDKIIVSPHIQVIFVQGNEESVTIEELLVDREKLNVVVKGNTLRLYLEGAKTITKNEKVDNHNRNSKRPIYKGTIVKAIVTYKNIEKLSLRGEQKFVCESSLEMEKFDLVIYGESKVYLNEVNINKLNTKIYGESYLEIKKGSIQNQKIVAYGESKVDAMNVENQNIKITAYGEGVFRFNVIKKLKVTSYGEATFQYTGNPDIQKGLMIGEASIEDINEKL